MKNNPLESLSKYHTGLCYYDVTLKRKSQGFFGFFYRFYLIYVIFSSAITHVLTSAALASLHHCVKSLLRLILEGKMSTKSLHH